MEGDRQGIIYDQIVGEVLSDKFSESSEPVYDEWMEKMGYSVEDIMPYLDIILTVRENEMKR